MLEPVARIRAHKRTETALGSASAKTVTSLLPQPSVLGVGFILIIKSLQSIYIEKIII
jgi:hypothetical protein